MLHPVVKMDFSKPRDLHLSFLLLTSYFLLSHDPEPQDPSPPIKPKSDLIKPNQTKIASVFYWMTR